MEESPHQDSEDDLLRTLLSECVHDTSRCIIPEARSHDHVQHGEAPKNWHTHTHKKCFLIILVKRFCHRSVAPRWPEQQVFNFSVTRSVTLGLGRGGNKKASCVSRHYHDLFGNAGPSPKLLTQTVEASLTFLFPVTGSTKIERLSRSMSANFCEVSLSCETHGTVLVTNVCCLSFRCSRGISNLRSFLFGRSPIDCCRKGAGEREAGVGPIAAHKSHIFIRAFRQLKFCRRQSQGVHLVLLATSLQHPCGSNVLRRRLS